jgi:hypothetical protein
MSLLGKRKRSPGPSPRRLPSLLGKRKRSPGDPGPSPKRLNQKKVLSPVKRSAGPSPKRLPSVLGKRKRMSVSIRKSTLPSAKRIDVGDTGDITTITDRYAKFTMSKQLVTAFKELSYESSRKMIEYAGKVDILNKSDSKVKIMTPTKYTSYLRGAVNPSPSLLSTLVTYHSHPSPRPLRNNVNEFRNYHSLPSNQDLLTYHNNYPRMQANIILDTNGYYVVDLVEGENHNIDTIIRAFNLYQQKDLSAYSRDIGGYQYFEVNPSTWKEIVNNSLNRVMRRHGVSMQYYTWNERGIITLTISR